MCESFSILSLLQSVCNNSLAQINTNHLINLAQNYALTYLRYRYQNLSKVLMAEDASLDEMAIDAIASLFERNDSGSFIRIKTAFESWQPPIQTEEQANFFLNRLVAKSAEKYVSELLRDSDPLFSKILDSINYLIEKQNYKKKQILGITFIVEDENYKKIGSLPNSSFIDELPLRMFTDSNKMLPSIFDYLKENTEKAAAIPLNALVYKIRKLKVTELNLTDKAEFNNETEIDSIIDKSIDSTISKMKDSYLIKGKINMVEAEGIVKALKKIAFDLRDGGINTGLHKYFLEQFPNFSFDDYHNKYQNIFEYLLKVLKKEIASQLDYKTK